MAQTHLLNWSRIVPTIPRLLVAGIYVGSIWLASAAYSQFAPTDIPSDVLELVGRSYACAEWSKRAFDPERKAQLADIGSILQSLHCGEVTNSERSLRGKYAGDPGILRVLDLAWVKVVQRVPLQMPVLPDANR
ncbi:hypothetical protein JJE66_11090 [Bradyrhizobium diazoefficiens]|uniref:hypothetical protein n=1 Tax=Bradyrhizobium diazoefficiens TaxID=1355477 RepID=UPI0019097F55|nr:hypothetical protein [Bradyrhizobium diazoefficiens]MBK3661792.1 hypothetical protein [Bradyrhizobium diazoefficiens]